MGGPTTAHRQFTRRNLRKTGSIHFSNFGLNLMLTNSFLLEEGRGSNRAAIARCWRRNVQNMPWLSAESNESVLGLETTDAKVHRSRPTAVDVVNNGRIDSGGSKRPGRYVAAVGKQGKD
ncbi:hypothetical protein B296_00009028 [Ensete ventricosum]|uniref:Uncharacterized protein n=1 Tax=Ensete ventricosum TaxID=4639 RepID=A0A426ZKM9_ENSVE|nr:hypothetical protein B296_00009028 [Ensete ventricosum]